jgi:hypothetical protein
MLCKKQLRKCEFARFPNGVVVHVDCAKDESVCPVTGQVFKFEKAS